MNKENETDVRGIAVLSKYVAELNKKGRVRAHISQGEDVALTINANNSWTTIARISFNTIPSESLAIQMCDLAQAAIDEYTEGGAA